MNRRYQLAAHMLAGLERVNGSPESRRAIDWYCLTIPETKRRLREDHALRQRMSNLVDWVQEYEGHQ